MRPNIFGFVTFYWIVVDLSEYTLLKADNANSSPPRDLVCLELALLIEFICAVLPLCAEDTALSFSASGSYTLSASSSTVISEPWEEGIHWISPI